jgi:hypothetical protein
MDRNFVHLLDALVLILDALWMGGFFFIVFKNLFWMEAQVLEPTMLIGHISNREKNKKKYI